MNFTSLSTPTIPARAACSGRSFSCANGGAHATRSTVAAARHGSLLVQRPSATKCLMPATKRRPSCTIHTGTTVLASATPELPANLQKIVGAFQMVPDPKARYKQLLFFASKLPAMAAEDHIDENKVTGCVSQVWVKPELKDGKVFWTADSDSQLTKGLAALLVQGLSDCEPEEIIKIEPSFIELLGLKQSLTPSRNNGFLNMLLLMQKKSLQLMAEAASQE